MRMPWAKTYDETDVLHRAMLAFWKTGYEATSMADLVVATGLNRGSIYSAFTDKRHLFLRALTHYDRTRRVDVMAGLRAGNAPREAILALFESAAAGGTDHEPGGCLLVNTVLEVAPHDAEIAGIVNSALQEVEGFFRECISDAAAEGTIRADIDAHGTARILLGLLLGMRVLTRATRHEAAIAAILSQVRRQLE